MGEPRSRVYNPDELIEELRKLPKDLPVYVAAWNDDREAWVHEPLWTGEAQVRRVDYDMPHIGGYYGQAVVLGQPDDD